MRSHPGDGIRSGWDQDSQVSRGLVCSPAFKEEYSRGISSTPELLEPVLGARTALYLGDGFTILELQSRFWDKLLEI